MSRWMLLPWQPRVVTMMLQLLVALAQAQVPSKGMRMFRPNK